MEIKAREPLIVGIDLSLCATGWATSAGAAGVLEPKGLRGMARVTWILDRIDTLTEHADLTVIEGYAFGAKGSAVFDIAELGGVVRFHLYDHKRAYCDVPPSCLKKFATGKGNAKKEDVLVAAVKQLGYEGSNHNVSDALFLLEMATVHYTGTAKNQAQREAIGKIGWPVIAKKQTLNDFILSA
jgi:crossover junction endodeoxyribonuclease RuvC